MTGLVERIDLTVRWTSLWYRGKATEDTIIIENTSKYPMEITNMDNLGVSIPSNNATKVIAAGGQSRGVIYSWSYYTFDKNDLSVATPAEVQTRRDLIGTDSLVSTANFAPSGDRPYQRLILMPGESLRENLDSFGNNQVLYLMHRLIQTVIVTNDPNAGS